MKNKRYMSLNNEQHTTLLRCIVRDLTDDEAIIIMVDSNLQTQIILEDRALLYDERRCGADQTSASSQTGQGTLNGIRLEFVTFLRNLKSYT